MEILVQLVRWAQLVQEVVEVVQEHLAQLVLPVLKDLMVIQAQQVQVLPGLQVILVL